jgi:hypothetical protein
MSHKKHYVNVRVFARGALNGLCYWEAQAAVLSHRWVLWRVHDQMISKTSCFVLLKYAWSHIIEANQSTRQQCEASTHASEAPVKPQSPKDPECPDFKVQRPQGPIRKYSNCLPP